VLPGNNNPSQAFVETPDGLRIEILEDKTQSKQKRLPTLSLLAPALSQHPPNICVRLRCGRT
jgi:hypothetical protein